MPDWSNLNEAETRKLLIEPALEGVGYSPLHLRHEQGAGGNRPDAMAYCDSGAAGAVAQASVIVEMKALNTDLDGAGQPRLARPTRQIRRYLKDHPASGPGTRGAVTDGNQWRVYERCGDDVRPDVRYVGQYRLFDDGGEASGLGELAGLIGRRAMETHLSGAKRGRRNTREMIAAVAVTELVRDNAEPGEILSALYDGEVQPLDLGLVTGKAKDAVREDWDRTAFAIGPALLETPSELFERRCVVGSIRLRPSEGTERLHREDVALAARTAARAGDGAAIVALHEQDRETETTWLRMATHANGHTGMTRPFAADQPPQDCLTRIVSLRKTLNHENGFGAEALVQAIDIRSLRQSFYRETAAWLGRKQDGRSKRDREALLRHLVRCVFAWILKETGILPEELFEAEIARRDGASYHDRVIRMLFHERMNTPYAARRRSGLDWLDDLVEGVPYLNGSLFARSAGDDSMNLTADDYFGTETERPGLFTVFSRYEWSPAENDSHVSEQAIDPDMLSNLFENLIVTTDADGTVDRMPGATYYTPHDIAREMTVDALAEAIRDAKPLEWTEEKWLGLYRGGGGGDWAEGNCPGLPDQLRRLRVFDPACGSGEFPYVAMQSLRLAIGRLEGWEANWRYDTDAAQRRAQETRRIVTEQIHGQDIHPMAAQIARLRLFIAIVEAEGTAVFDRPLPNLEATIVCADTLHTQARSGWHPLNTGDLIDSDKEIRDCVSALHDVWSRWPEAFREEEKNDLRAEDRLLRGLLAAALENYPGTSDAYSGLADGSPLETGSGPVRSDPRLIHGKEHAEGFDIVIGNPPYERMCKALEKELAERRGYATTGRDLYNAFCEASLAIARDGGVVELVVPLSLSFGKDQLATRNRFERECRKISLRHHDVRPDTTFQRSPVTHPENRQRTTLITAVKGHETLERLCTGGLLKWASGERARCLVRRDGADLDLADIRRHTGDAQWPRIGNDTEYLAMGALLKGTITVERLIGGDGEGIGLPRSAMLFITVTKAEQLQNRGEDVRQPPGERETNALLLLLNSHFGFAWWRWWGDGFHVKWADFTNLRVPEYLLENHEAQRLGRDLTGIVDKAPKVVQKSGTKGKIFESLNLHEAAPEWIASANETIRQALGLDGAVLKALERMQANIYWGPAPTQ